MQVLGVLPGVERGDRDGLAGRVGDLGVTGDVKRNVC